MKKYIFGWCCVLLLALAATASLNAQGNGSQGNPGISPPNAKPHGLSYGEWSARWWQWAFSIPKSVNPLVYDDAPCGVMQTGNVWFLAGKGFGASGAGIRNCTIPSGTSLFFPVINSVWDDTEVDPGTGALSWDTFTPNQLRDMLKANLDTTVVSFSCFIDGKQVRGLDSILTTPYRVQSPVFSYTLPSTLVPRDNLLGVDFSLWTAPPPPLPSTPTGTVPWVVADGVFLMLEPLAPGIHTIYFTGTFSYGFAFDITYTVDVLPRGQFKK